MRRHFKHLFPSPISWGRLARAARRYADYRRMSGDPVFIVGCGRSGTTLLLAILSADPRLYCINQEAEGFINTENAGAPRLFLGRLRTSWMILWQQDPLAGRVRWVEKTPRHIYAVDAIRKAYRGRVRFVHLVRDGRDVITSKLPGRETYHISGPRWVQDVGAGLRHENDPDFLVVRYEDLVMKFDATTERLYHHLGLTPPGQIREFATRATVQHHHAWSANLQDLHSKSIGRWRAEPLKNLIAEFLLVDGARELLAHHGYAVDESDS
jgi:hypothetical protein